ncbi:class I SAM-dependent methyltransferase [Nocardioides cavernae]|uniref:Class I SAM-dependent methyltransferase n=1 Tax=Nocardioides cavernae TaxID=1921566 RepID=A0ABR8NES9_9ACTN|nr:class I SAM-dependent methyltransferase [Nocardioides cavernae]MBD3926645.1 class I SAM-dependent methyltransferase [Nocardioides cavernae]MBM7512367.1 SAM-dependent methyltransferase [Nocardioides cavernae]
MTQSNEWDDYAELYPQIDNEVTLPVLLRTALSLVEGRRFLDVGCGEGTLLDVVRAETGGSWDITGFEISAARAERAKERGHHVLVSEDGKVPLPGGSADIVASTHVVEHVPDDAAYVREMARLARPGGVVYIETPLKLSGAWYFRRNPEAGWVLDPTHLREYRTAGEVHALLQQAGLELLSEDVTPISYPLVAAEGVLRRVLKRPQRTGRPQGLRAARINIPRYRALGVLAQKPA